MSQEQQKRPLIDRIHDELSLKDPDPDRICDLIEEVTGDSPLIDGKNLRGKLLTLRKAGKVSLLHELAVLLRKIAERQRASGTGEKDFIELYENMATIAEDAVAEVQAIEKNISSIGQTSATTRGLVQNTFNAAGDEYRRNQRAS